MTGRLYLRHSVDKQTNARQLHSLDHLLKSGAPKYEDPATSSRVYATDRAGFRALLDEAAVGDTIRIADSARLFRSTKDVIRLRPSRGPERTGGSHAGRAPSGSGGIRNPAPGTAPLPVLGKQRPYPPP
ncbi:recombinase family protein [Streptomyces wuyuanensis]|uniref:recombinase family protein n=1 Tax=Streptomyces wuyuanensis TaxID=1196353 RepID=UPI0037199506